MKQSAKQLINQILSCLNDRQRDIVESRYGLVNAEPLTLQAIGYKYGITREGIRRIEAQAIENIEQHLSKTDIRNFIKLIINNVRKFGGVRKEADLVNDISLLINETTKPLLTNYLKFLLEISNSVSYHPENIDFHNYWYLGNKDRQKAVKFINDLVKAIKAKEPINNYLKTPNAATYISISKKFAVNPYGDFGLAESKEIVPRSARDWAYLILKKENRPLHFFELAEMVNKFQNKKSHPQTVHNELIKDDKFVLVGKGMYALKEHGYVAGIAREVIARLLKNKGPLASQEVIKLVLKERFFKENTVLINLQNKNYFKRLPDGRYTNLV